MATQIPGERSILGSGTASPKVLWPPHVQYAGEQHGCHCGAAREVGICGVVWGFEANLKAFLLRLQSRVEEVLA